MTAKEIIDTARTLPYCSDRWGELFAACGDDPHLLREVLAEEQRAYHREEYLNGMI